MMMRSHLRRRLQSSMQQSSEVETALLIHCTNSWSVLMSILGILQDRVFHQNTFPFLGWVKRCSAAQGGVPRPYSQVSSHFPVPPLLSSSFTQLILQARHILHTYLLTKHQLGLDQKTITKTIHNIITHNITTTSHNITITSRPCTQEKQYYHLRWRQHRRKISLRWVWILLLY